MVWKRVIFTLFLLALALGINDVYQLQNVHAFAFDAAYTAAARGARVRHDPARGVTFVDDAMPLDPFAATDAAQDTLENIMYAHGVTGFRYQIGVIPYAEGGTVQLPDPCVPRIVGRNAATTWTTPRPAVCVCVQIQATNTILLRLINRGQTIPLNVFAAAQVADRR